MKTLYKYLSKTTMENKENAIYSKNNNYMIEIIKNNETNYTINHQYEEKNYSPINFKVYFYEKIQRELNPLEIEYKDGEFFVLNKEFFLEKLNEKTFDYLKKYIFKAKEVNQILYSVKESLKYENLEQELEEKSIFPYLFKINDIKNINNLKLETVSPEIYSGWNIPTITEYTTEKINKETIKINFLEILNEEKSSSLKIKDGLKKALRIPKEENFEFDFIIKGYYIYNTETDSVEKIEVDKEIKFYNIKTLTKRILEIEGFKIEGKTYDEIKEEMYKYLNLMKNKEIIDKKKIMNFINKISFLERNRVFETVKSYVEKNKISFLKFDTGEIRTNEHVLLFFEENLKKYMKIGDENTKINLEKSKEDDIQEIKELSEKDRKEKLKIMYREIFSAINSNEEIIFQMKEFKEKVKLLTKEEKEKLFKNIEFSIPKENCILKLKTNENRSYMYSRDIIKLFKEILEI
ncbi:hypothetical protein [Leptotrichia massiliensis]|uniref:hypothetical protein n=1 Tax=Leptotrichia massiliensis TaxID=1852388 RepID=UPI0028D2183D|nr:hypothetical protein [Leptotrichia massiliensis]